MQKSTVPDHRAGKKLLLIGYQSDHWSAPGNLLNGDRSERARFMLMPPPSGNTLTIGPVFHRNRLTLPSSVDGLNYSYEADEGSSVADISAEVSAASGWVALAGHRGASVAVSFDGFVSGCDCGEEDHDDAQNPHTVRQHLGWGIAWGYFHYAPDSGIRVPLTENPAHDAPGAASPSLRATLAW